MQQKTTYILSPNIASPPILYYQIIKLSVIQAFGCQGCFNKLTISFYLSQLGTI